MSKVYIAAAFRMFSDRADSSKAYGSLKDSSQIKRLEKIEDIFLNYGYSCCLPHRDEGRWGQDYYEPGPLGALCLRHVETSDIIFAIAEGGRGVHIELGFASAFPDKKLILLYDSKTEPSTLIWGLSNDYSPWVLKNRTNKNRVIIKSYEGDNDLFVKTEAILSQILKLKKTKKPNSKRIIGTIDIGSHTLKCRIFSYYKGGTPNLLYKANNSLGIINDILNSEFFTEETLNSIITKLMEWKEKCEQFACHSIVITGTAALRNAKNTSVLLSRVKKQIGVDIELIDANKELNLLYSGVRSSFPNSEQIGVLGLGGGSIQIGIGRNKVLDNKYFLDFGTNLITKMWVWEKPFSKAEYSQIVKFVYEKFREQVPKNVKIKNLVYTGGETEFMLKCELPLEVTNLSPVHVSQIDIDSFEKFCFEFAKMNPEEVFTKYNLDPKWAMGAIAANTIALVTAKLFGVSNIIPSNFNISEGILLTAK